MTFTEAALEVLRAVGEPLHYKRITELAIERNLLSHVGKSPEVTMISRLATLVKTDRGQGPIVKVKPGVFAVREVAGEAASAAGAAGDNGAGDPAQPLAEPTALPGADVFPEEEGDDDPILAGLDEGGAEAGAAEGGGEGGAARGSRRRRRRRGRGGRGDGEPLPPNGPRQDAPQGADRGPRREPAQNDAGPRRDFRPNDRGPRRDFSNDRGPRREAQPQLDMGRQPADGDLLGKDLADAAFAVLSQAERTPLMFARVADLLVRRGRLAGDPSQLAPTVAAALRADVALATRARTRPRFRIRDGEVALAAWRLPRDAARWEDDAERAAERQRAEVRRAFIARLNELPAAGFAELLASWLNAEGVASLRAVRRPGSSGSAFHFAGVLRRGAEEQRLAIVVQRAGRDIDREAVIDVRGALPHYGSATSAWLVSTGRIMSGAREEVALEGASPCAVFDGPGLANAMERTGIGLRQYQLPLADIDFDLLESLGDTSDRRDRRDEGRFPPPGREAPRAQTDASTDEGGSSPSSDAQQTQTQAPNDAAGEAEADDLAAESWDDDDEASEAELALEEESFDDRPTPVPEGGDESPD